MKPYEEMTDAELTCSQRGLLRLNALRLSCAHSESGRNNTY